MHRLSKKTAQLFPQFTLFTKSYISSFLIQKKCHIKFPMSFHKCAWNSKQPSKYKYHGLDRMISMHALQSVCVHEPGFL